LHYNEQYSDEYEQYEEQFNPLRIDRQARRKRKPKTNHVPKKETSEVALELADKADGLEGGFVTTYQPSRYEETWLLESLRPFYELHFIHDVLALVKGGKEASVYRCAAILDNGNEAPLLAAKVYRPRMFRQLRNDALYREGRMVLTGEGHEVRENERRVMRALSKKTAYGDQVAHTSWLMHEFTTMQTLYEAGAAVPKPVSASENAILMSYIGDAYIAAPILQLVELETDELVPLFNEVIRNVELMLEHGLIHGDLSAYNILYWDGAITLIDFPQVAGCHSNSSAYMILQRDIERICQYFAGQGLERDASTIMGYLWKRYVERRPQDVAADLSVLLEKEEEEE
jgi:RIO kinase 1